MGEKMRVNIGHSGIVSPKDVARVAEQEAERHNKKIRDEVEELLEISTRTKTLINLVSEQYRSSGKSTLLLEKAKELDVTLVIPNNQERLLFSYEETNRFAIGAVMSFSGIDSVRGVRLRNNGFLVDEGVPSEIIKELSMNNEFLGGFGRL